MHQGNKYVLYLRKHEMFNVIFNFTEVSFAEVFLIILKSIL